MSIMSGIRLHQAVLKGVVPCIHHRLRRRVPCESHERFVFQTDL